MRTRIGEYEILGELGRGGMGVIYRARCARLGREVAVKVLIGQASAELLARFDREGRVLATVRHPNVVPVIDVGREGELPFIVMELVPGVDLDRRVASHIEETGRVPPWRFSRRIAAEMATALAECHRQGVVHRDVKPKNVLVTDGDRPILVDFGLVRGKGASLDALTKTNQMLGTPGFMAPEQVDPDSFGRVGPAADVWGLGACLFYCLAGGAPFEGESDVNIVKKLLTEPPRRLSELAPDAPAELVELCTRCLAKTPDERPTAEEIPEILAAARRASGRLAKRRVTQARRSGPPIGAIVGGAIALVGITAAIAVVTLGTGETEAPAPTPEAVASPSPAVAPERDPEPAPEPASPQSPSPALLDRARAAIRDRALWTGEDEEVHHAAIEAVGRALGAEFAPLPEETKVYTCPPGSGNRHRIGAFRHRASGLVLHLLPGGTLRGRTRSREISPLLVGRTEVTDVAWRRVEKNEASLVGDERARGFVSHRDARTWLASAKGELRLPHSYEWAWSCFAGGPTRWFCGEGDLDMLRLYAWTAESAPRSGGLRDSRDHWNEERWNAFGLVDTLGNAWEWTQTPWADLAKNQAAPGEQRYAAMGGGMRPLESFRRELGTFPRPLPDDGKPLDAAEPGSGFRVFRDVPEF